MKLAIQLLEQKNNYLVQFKKIGDFECRRLQSGDYSHIEQFYYSRQIILDAIGHIDEHLKRYNPKNISESHKETVFGASSKKPRNHKIHFTKRYVDSFLLKRLAV